MLKSIPTHLRLNLPTVASVFAVAVASVPLAFGQSGSRNAASPPSAAAYDSASRIPADGLSRGATKIPIALHGYCPVCLVDLRQWIKGDERLATDFDGKKYVFPGREQAEKFNHTPLKYVPVLGGDDVVHFARTGRRAEGMLSYGVVHKGRTYFFASAENKQLFQSSPERFENVDLALGGECIVCRIDISQRVPGDPKFTVLYRGLRYQFPGEEQQATFVKSPARYVQTLAPPPGNTPPASGTRPSSAPQQSVSGSGTR